MLLTHKHQRVIVGNKLIHVEVVFSGPVIQTLVPNCKIYLSYYLFYYKFIFLLFTNIIIYKYIVSSYFLNKYLLLLNIFLPSTSLLVWINLPNTLQGSIVKVLWFIQVSIHSSFSFAVVAWSASFSKHV